MATAQLRAPLYWPWAEFMYLVFTTSTGEAITVVQKPAPNADVKWQGRSSVKNSSYKYFCHGLILQFAVLSAASSYQSSARILEVRL